MFEDTLLDSHQTLLPNIPLVMRGKHFAFTKNVSAAQSIEVVLERFGIMVNSGKQAYEKAYVFLRNYSLVSLWCPFFNVA